MDIPAHAFVIIERDGYEPYIIAGSLEAFRDAQWFQLCALRHVPAPPVEHVTYSWLH